ncbi:MAG: type II toxin-antitoxin system HicB family antitoxin [Ferruginibacter sp.]|nr:type II toxin-antitoxin system HicB family antitoxin [Ferruginibacter sp.]
MQYNYKILLNKEEGAGYMVTVSALPGCIIQGDTVDEALIMSKEAIELYVEELQSGEGFMPDNSNTQDYSINLQTA